MARKSISRPAGEPNAARFVSYIRVSTAGQGASGLGLEAQRDAVDRHVRGAGGKLVAEFREVESGRKNDRPEMTKALAACRAHHAVLAIAKLDRLSRNAHFLIGLRDSGVEIAICDMPNADRLTVGIMALVAEREREMIAARTKAALAVVKRAITETGSWKSRRSGQIITRLGNARPAGGSREAARKAAEAASVNARKRAADIVPYIEAARNAGCATLGQLAEALTARGIKTPGGCDQWSSEQVRRILKRTRGTP